MIRNLRELKGYSVLGLDDAELGEIVDFYFDDDAWTVRYLVIDTGEWLHGRRVLLAPFALSGFSPEDEAVTVDLSRERIQNSPDIDVSLPLTVDREQELHRYYEWPLYWSTMEDEALGTGSLAAVPLADLAEEMRETDEKIARGDLEDVDFEEDSEDITPTPGGMRMEEEGKNVEEEDILMTESGPRLTDLGPHATSERVPSESLTEPAQHFVHSFDKFVGYAINARDGKVGKVDDLIVEDEGWGIIYLVVDTGGLLSGNKVLISPQWVDRLDWDASDVYVDLKKDTVEHSPRLESGVPLDREFETRIYDHYGKHPYWEDRGTDKGEITGDESR